MGGKASNGCATRQCRTSGSVRGVPSNGHPYRNQSARPAENRRAIQDQSCRDTPPIPPSHLTPIRKGVPDALGTLTVAYRIRMWVRVEIMQKRMLGLFSALRLLLGTPPATSTCDRQPDRGTYINVGRSRFAHRQDLDDITGQAVNSLMFSFLQGMRAG